MIRSSINIIKTSGFLFVVLFFLMCGCSESKQQAHNQELIDLVAEVEELKVKVKAKQLEKKQLENQLAQKDERIKEYFDYMDYVGKRCP